jgi:GH25 family lysozyme M1 (1,4-beta-N-acetylmuramidase)
MRAGTRGRALVVIAGLAAALGVALPAGALTSARAATLTGIPASSSNPVLGTDVSGTTVTDWTQVAAGNSFVGIEAIQGLMITNSNYESQAAAASAAGLYVMPYVFADPAKITGASEFDRAWTVINGPGSSYSTGGKYLPVALDLEWDTVNFPAQECYGLTPSATLAWIQDFINEAQAAVPQVTPVIYTSQRWWDDCTGDSAQFSADPLWIADYDATPALPAAWPGYTFWQSSNKGTISGIAGQSDADQMQAVPALVTSQIGANFELQVQSLNLLAGQEVTSYNVTGLPAGLQMSPSGLITGHLTTTDAGLYQVLVASSDSSVVPSSLSFTLDVYAPLTLTAPAGVTTTVGAPVSAQIGSADVNADATGYTPPVFSASGLPAGTGISAAGLITGWPSASGIYHVTVSARDGLGSVASASFTWTVRAMGDSGTAGTIRQQGGSGKCLDDPSGRVTAGTSIDLATCTGKANQAWTSVQDGSIRVLGHCLAASGSHVVLYPCDGSIADQWRAGTDGSLVSARYGTCLNGPSGAVANGTRPTLAACANSTSAASQHWTRPVIPVVSGVGARCLGAAGATAELSNCGNYSAQHWLVAANAQVVVQSANCLSESGTAAGSAITVTKCVNAASQHWRLVAAGIIADEIVSTASGLCVTVPSATSGAGAPLVLGACSAALTSTWRVN